MTSTVVLETLLIATIMAIYNSPDEEHAELLQSSKVDECRSETASRVSEMDVSLVWIETPNGASPYELLHTALSARRVLTMEGKLVA